MAMTRWMSWEGGVDLVACTRSELVQPNIIIHVARVVHTPVGCAPAGMLLYQPDPSAPPALAGFISTDSKIAEWFGPNIFAGTPFERAPALTAGIAVGLDGARVTSRVEVAGKVLEVALAGLEPLVQINRRAGEPMPFSQQGLEARAGQVELKVDGRMVAITVPAVAISGGPGALFAPCGIYAR